MKSTRDFRNHLEATSADTLKKAVKLEPIRKSGKDKHAIYRALGADDDQDDDPRALPKRESVLDYMDDGDQEIWDEDSEIEYDDDFEEEFEEEEEEEEEEEV